MTLSEAPLIFSKALRSFWKASATILRTSAMLLGPNFLLSCKGPVLFHFQRIATSVCFAVCCTRTCTGPVSYNLCGTTFSVFESHHFSYSYRGPFFFHHLGMPPTLTAARDHSSSMLNCPWHTYFCLGSHAGVICGDHENIKYSEFSRRTRRSRALWRS